ncbi:MAG TPA: hypothetical protein DCR24_00285 [Bacillus bacterium]|nr:hypothetical protein [Bacillus sp. (in: firmicutes)]
MRNESESIEKLLVSLIKMVGKTNEKVDELTKRVRQLEIASKEQKYNRVYSFIAEPPSPSSSFGKKEYSNQ